MKILLDTHIFLWLISGDKRLRSSTKNVFLDPENRLYFSAASMWEISIKISLGKLVLSDGWQSTIQRELRDNSINWLPIEMKHCLGLVDLPFHHRDPFNRMLISQAKTEQMSILSGDNVLSAYEVQVIR